MKDSKKIKNTLAVLEAQRESAIERLQDKFHVENWAWLSNQLTKLNVEIHKLKKML